MELRDEFLSEEDLDLRTLTPAELEAYWTAWLIQAQATNDLDADVYSHGVFATDGPISWPTTATVHDRSPAPGHAGRAATPERRPRP